MQLPKSYNAKEAEKKWQEFWEKNKIYKFDPKSKKPVYSIDVPPPYASAGHLHVGHALHYTQFEIIARFRRMFGFNVYFAPCFDDNGLPTEKYVEEKLGISKKDTTKAEFRKLCLEESKKVEAEYTEKVFKALGHSYDWSLLYTTISKEAQKVAQRSFINLVKQKDCYRSEEPTIWCTKHQTALAQAEVEDLTRNTNLNYINFDLENGEKINIATTRPELLSSCVGIFVNPKDKRYTSLIGKKAIVPIFKQKVPIMKDEKVDMEFGSGIVMICTFGDTTDIEWWKKHKLPLKVSITKDGTLNELAGTYQGLKLKEAREKIIQDLEQEGRLTNQEPLQQTLGSCWRCQTPIEFIVTKQWFIKTLDYKKQLIQQAKKINWYPKFFLKRFEDWTNNLAWDWCISRQRFYGVPIPVWYCEKCDKEILPDEKALPIDPEQTKPKKKCSCGHDKLIPDQDVFDTWMTSSMSPQIAIKWLENPKDFKKLFPTSLRPQAQDIIRTWAFYTILKSYLHFNSIPWKDIAIGTFILDEKGHGMSKSKGNVVWADNLLKQFDVDTFRYWVGTAKWGSDLPFQEKELVAGQRFITKLWNASKFAFMHIENYTPKKPKELEIMDKWILSKLSNLIQQTTSHYEKYNTSEAKYLAEQFFWHNFCDNYLEIIKDRIYNPDKRTEEGKASAQYTLYQTLLTILKLIAPIMPHITEEIYQSYFIKHEKSKSIHISEWPKFDSSLIDKKAEQIGDLFISLLQEIRQLKSKQNKSLAAEIILTLDKKHEKIIQPVLDDFKAATKAKEIKFGKFAVEF